MLYRKSLGQSIVCLMGWFLLGVTIIIGIPGCNETPKSETVEQTKPSIKPEKQTPRPFVNVLQTDEEKQFLRDYSCMDNRVCYSPGKFEKYILAKYPDIGRVRFNEREIKDKETFMDRKQAFRRALYFAKEIKLADGQTLFDFITKCSKDVSPTSYAEVAVEQATRDIYFHLQYFPTLRSVATNDPIEMNILLTRKGDKIEAASPMLSTTMLNDKDFMKRHGIACWGNK